MGDKTQDILSVLEEELNRIVLDVHDGPVQNLFAALSLLTQLQHELEQHPQSHLKQRVQQISEIIEASLKEIKFFLGTFRSPGFRDQPLTRLVKNLIMQHEDWTGQIVELDLNEIPENIILPSKIALYRVLQEALSNGHRHADSKYQYVKLWSEDDQLCLQVSDDGVGFQPPDFSQPANFDAVHIGLRGMHERMSLVGGSFELESQIGIGTTITIKVPQS